MVNIYELLNRIIVNKRYSLSPNLFIEADRTELSEEERSIFDLLKNIVSLGTKIHNDGIEFVVISLGEEGSIVGFNNKIYKVTVPKVNAINPVGSGDSYVAGVAIGLARNYNINDVLKLASACGTANAMEKETGSVRKEIVDELIDKIRIEVLE